VLERKAGSRTGPSVPPELLRSLPLLGASGILVVFGAVVLRFDPGYGPGAFPLWALLLVLAVICCIGGIASWLLAEDGAGARPARTEHRPRTPRSAPEPSAGPVRALAGDRLAYGRPAPHVLRRAPLHLPSAPRGRTARPAVPRLDWDESGRRESFAPAPAAPRPEFDRPSEVLEDLDQIEQQLSARSHGPHADGRPTA
jgi:hypothetical protein